MVDLDGISVCRSVDMVLSCNGYVHAPLLHRVSVHASDLEQLARSYQNLLGIATADIRSMTFAHRSRRYYLKCHIRPRCLWNVVGVRNATTTEWSDVALMSAAKEQSLPHYYVKYMQVMQSVMAATSLQPIGFNSQHSQTIDLRDVCSRHLWSSFVTGVDVFVKMAGRKFRYKWREER